MTGYDRNDVLERTDLAALADELLDGHVGTGRSAMWRCPMPTHGQTGKTPPVNIFVGRTGQQRWHCHGCGAGGTAIDLVQVIHGFDFKSALEVLGQRVQAPTTARHAPRARPQASSLRPQGRSGPMSDDAMTYIAACEQRLWSSKGKPVRQYLMNERGLSEEVLRSNRVGADPGPRFLPRAKGLPRRGEGAVFPVWQDSVVTYLQVRYLAAVDRRYDNPSNDLADASPRLAEVQSTARSSGEPLIVCEGLPDAYSVAQVGRSTIAVLAAGYPDQRLALDLIDRFGDTPLVLALDNDERGSSGAARLDHLLRGNGFVADISQLSIPDNYTDMNQWMVSVGTDRFAVGLTEAVNRTRCTSTTLTTPLVPPDDIGLAPTL